VAASGRGVGRGVGGMGRGSSGLGGRKGVRREQSEVGGRGFGGVKACC